MEPLIQGTGYLVGLMPYLQGGQKLRYDKSLLCKSLLRWS